MALDARLRQSTAIRHIACPLGGAPWFATGEWESAVEVWSLAERRRESRFETVLDGGGRRLALLAGDRLVVVGGAFHQHGICAYDALSGDRLWQRKELKRVQALDPLPEGRVAAGFADRSLHVLDGETGETVMTIRGAAEMYGTERAPTGLAAGRSGAQWVGLYDLGRGKRLWKAGLFSFAILHAALGDHSLAITEVGGLVRCFDYDGIERWRWTPPTAEHVVRLAWCASLGRFCGVLAPFAERRLPAALVTFGGDGGIDQASSIGHAFEYEFASAGDALVVATLDGKHLSAGVVVAVPDAQVTWRFREAAPLVAGD